MRGRAKSALSIAWAFDQLQRPSALERPALPKRKRQNTRCA